MIVRICIESENRILLFVFDFVKGYPCISSLRSGGHLFGIAILGVASSRFQRKLSIRYNEGKNGNENSNGIAAVGRCYEPSRSIQPSTRGGLFFPLLCIQAPFFECIRIEGISLSVQLSSIRNPFESPRSRLHSNVFECADFLRFPAFSQQTSAFQSTGFLMATSKRWPSPLTGKRWKRNSVVGRGVCFNKPQTSSRRKFCGNFPGLLTLSLTGHKTLRTGHFPAPPCFVVALPAALSTTEYRFVVEDFAGALRSAGKMWKVQQERNSPQKSTLDTGRASELTEEAQTRGIGMLCRRRESMLCSECQLRTSRNRLSSPSRVESQTSKY